jgi:hypothetical protein
MRCNDQLVNAGLSRVGQFEATRLAGYRVFNLMHRGFGKRYV